MLLVFSRGIFVRIGVFIGKIEWFLVIDVIGNKGMLVLFFIGVVVLGLKNMKEGFFLSSLCMVVLLLVSI